MKAYKFRLKTNKAFIEKCEATLKVCCELYNAALQERRDAWQTSGISINFQAQALQLPQIKPLRPDVDAIYSQVLQDVLRRLSKTFDAFFRRMKNGETPGYPRFKSKSRYDSFCYPQSGFKIEGEKLSLSKIGSCRMRLSRPIEGTIKTCTIKREADGWYVVFAVEENQSRFIPKTGRSTGVDVGIESFATLSNGQPIENPEYYRAAEKELKTAQRRVSRRPNKRSHRRGKAVKLLARKHQKVRRQRTHFHHTTALDLIREYDELAIEDLNIKGLVKNPHLAKSISDAGWGNFAEILTHKAEEAGRRVERVPARFTSQECSQCGRRVKKSLSVRRHVCECGFVAHRDHNAALNIEQRGRAGPSGIVPSTELNEPRIPHYNRLPV